MATIGNSALVGLAGCSAARVLVQGDVNAEFLPDVLKHPHSAEWHSVEHAQPLDYWTFHQVKEADRNYVQAASRATRGELEWG